MAEGTGFDWNEVTNESCFLSMLVKAWRKGQDSNLRDVNLLVFKTSAINHSATLPSLIIPYINKI